VSGLLTGQDIAASVLQFTRRNRGRWDALLVPTVALFEGRFLDDMTLDDLKEATGLTAIPVEPSPSCLVKVFFTGEK
jgi:hypothetical protein